MHQNWFLSLWSKFNLKKLKLEKKTSWQYKIAFFWLRFWINILSFICICSLSFLFVELKWTNDSEPFRHDKNSARKRSSTEMKWWISLLNINFQACSFYSVELLQFRWSSWIFKISLLLKPHRQVINYSFFKFLPSEFC